MGKWTKVGIRNYLLVTWVKGTNISLAMTPTTKYKSITFCSDDYSDLASHRIFFKVRINKISFTNTTPKRYNNHNKNHEKTESLFNNSPPGHGWSLDRGALRDVHLRLMQNR